MMKFKLTLMGGVVAFLIFLVSIIFEMDLFEKVIGALESLERYEIDELVIPFIVFLLFAYLDQSRSRRSREIEFEKIKIYKAMLSSAHHVLNNFLNQMQLFKIKAQNTPGFDAKVLSVYDQITKDASTQLEALGSITNIDEATIHESVKPK